MHITYAMLNLSIFDDNDDEDTDRILAWDVDFNIIKTVFLEQQAAIILKPTAFQQIRLILLVQD